MSRRTPRRLYVILPDPNGLSENEKCLATYNGRSPRDLRFFFVYLSMHWPVENYTVRLNILIGEKSPPPGYFDISTDPDITSQVRSGQVRSGQTKSSQIKASHSQIRPNQIRSDQAKSDQVKSGQVTSSQIRSGQIKSGQFSSVQLRSSQVKSSQV